MPFKIKMSATANDYVNMAPRNQPASEGKPGRLSFFQPPDFDSNQPPLEPMAPSVQISGGAALLCWNPLKQGVTRIVLQAMPVKKPTAKCNFKKFEVGGKRGGKQTVITTSADRISSSVIGDLEMDTWYVFRIVASNSVGAVEGLPSAAKATGDLAIEADDQEKTSKKKQSRRASKLGSRLASLSGQAAAENSVAAVLAEPIAESAKEASLSSSSSPPASSSIEETESLPAPVESTEAKAEKEQEKENDKEKQKEKTDTAMPSNEGQCEAESSSETPPPVQRQASEPKVSKSMASRLGVNIDTSLLDAPSKLEEKEARRKEAAMMFQKEEKASDKSKIYQALNPKPLWYESRREKEERDDDEADNLIHVRGGATGVLVTPSRDYALVKDDQGNTILESDDEEDCDDAEGYDTDEAPDFGEMEEEFVALRAQRAEEEKLRKKKLKEEWEQKKIKEQEKIEAELELIKKREESIKKGQEVTENDVTAAQKRVEEETAKFMTFSWNAQ